MDQEIAAAVAIGIAVVEFVIWLYGVRTMLRATRERRALAEQSDEDFGSISTAAAVTGSTELPGHSEELSTKLSEQLARNGLGVLGPIKITSADRREVRFESIGGGPGAGGSSPVNVRGGVVQFSAAGNKTRVEYRVETDSGRVLLGVGWLFVAIGLTALATGLCLVLALVVTSPQGAVRAQSVQMIQAIHFMWPPILLGQLARQPIRLIRNQFEALIHNLPCA
jgi:hypothetical protein